LLVNLEKVDREEAVFAVSIFDLLLEGKDNMAFASVLANALHPCCLAADEEASD
jgi:hypothetical protein